jgi:hypothetical protein
MVYTLHSTGHLDKIFCCDEAWLYLSGYVNSQNSRIWSADNPHTFHERPLHSLKVGVWCAVSWQRIIGPIFFSKTITAERYQDFSMNFIFLWEVYEQDCWFQQDGATVHTANSTMQMLNEFFGGRIFLEACGLLDLQIYRHQISVFGGFRRRTCTKTTRTHLNNWNKILSCAFQTSLQKLFTGLHQTWGKEWMHTSLNAVDISNTWYNIVFCFLISM